MPDLIGYWNDELAYGVLEDDPIGGVATAGAILETVIDAAGDLLVGTAADTVTVLPVGGEGEVLIVDGSQAAGVRWGGQAVESVNGEAGEVVLDATHVGALWASDGGGDFINGLGPVTGATSLDLGLGNIQWIATTGGNYTLSVTGGIYGRSTLFTLIIDTTTTGHTPTWFANITWIGGTPNITWTSGTRQIFQFLSIDGTNWTGWHLSPSLPVYDQSFSISGTLAVTTAGHRLYNDSGEARTITSVRASVKTAPTGASILVDVHKDGTTIFTTQGDRATIVASGFTDEATPNVTAWADGSYLEVMVDQIGSTIAGADLTVTVSYTQGS